MTSRVESAKRLGLRQVLVIALLFGGYASYYFCRSDLSVAMPMLSRELQHKGMSADLAMVRLGAMVSVGVMAYAAGKFLLGGLGDVWGGRRNFLGGLGGAIVFTLLFTLGGGLPVFTIAWVGNRLVQSMGWAGLIKVCSQWFSYRAYGTVIGILSLSFLIGDAVARQWMGLLIARGYGWRSLFYLAAIVGGVVLAANLVFLKESRTGLGFRAAEVNPLNVFGKQGKTGGGLKGLVLPLLKNAGFLIVCFLSFCTTIVRETFNTWTPTYLHNFLSYSDSAAAGMSAVFPALGAVSVIIAGLAGDRLGVSGRSIVLFIGMVMTAAGLGCMAVLKPGTQGGLPLILIGLVGLGLLGPYSYLAGALALDFGGERGGATSSGFIDGVGYAGGILAGDSVARLSVHFGWSGVFVTLAGVSAASALAAGFLFAQQRRGAAKATAAQY